MNNPQNTRLSRINRRIEELGIVSTTNPMGHFDNTLKSLWRVNDEELDYINDNASEEELDVLMGNVSSRDNARVYLNTLRNVITKFNDERS